MKIIHIIAYYNAIWDYQENHLAHQQALLGHEVHILSSNLNFPYTDYQNTAEDAIGPRVKPFGSFHNGSYTIHYLPIYFEISARVVFKNLIKKIKELNPDLIIVHGITQPATIQLCYTKMIKCPKIVDEHALMSDISDNKKIKTLSLFGMIFSKKIMRSYNKIVSIADGTTELLTKLMHLKPEKIQLIPLGTDTNFYIPNDDLGTQFRSENNIPLHAIVIGYTGKIEKIKQIEILIEACDELRIENMHLLLVGNIEKSYQPLILEKLKTLSIPYTLLPFQQKQKLPSVYNACSFLAWPAHQSISMMDVAACGKPFICPNYLKERLNHNQAIGLESGNKNQLKEALTKLIVNEDLRNEMGKNARNWATQELSWTIVNKKFISIN